MPKHLYNGGMEHTTLHLLYSRFIYKILFDLGYVNSSEPYARRHSHGMVLAEDGRKMSKSLGNSVSPNEIVNKFGADTLRVYEMFMGPFEQSISWNNEGVEGCYRFLSRVWRLAKNNLSEEKTPQDLTNKLHQTIKKVGSDLEKMKFNTAVAFMMGFINEWSENYLNKREAELFVKVLAPFAPFLAEEIWCEVFKNEFSIHQQPWPEYDKKLLKQEGVTIIIQINGRMRGQLEVESNYSRLEDKVKELAKKEGKIAGYLKGKKIKKVVFVPGRIINFVL